MCARRDNFIAVSTASEPDEVKNTRDSGMGAMSTRTSANCSAGALVNGSNVE